LESPHSTSPTPERPNAQAVTNPNIIDVLRGAPLLIAHRGGRGLAPENTMFAFRQAVDVWAADMIELDLQVSSDGHAMVIHDPTVDRTTNGSGVVRERTAAELQTLDAGYRFTADGRTYPFRGQGIRISTIDEVLDALPTTRFTVELKTGAAQRALAAAIERTDSTGRVIIAGERRAFRTDFAGYTGGISACREDALPFYVLHRLRLSFLGRVPAHVVQMPEYFGRTRALTPRLIRELHAIGVQVHVWTVNELADMQRLLDWGIDGIVTDYPDRLARLLHERLGRPLPPGLRDQVL
jgi:glycerophosphoryl diester phosphodiesterase